MTKLRHNDPPRARKTTRESTRPLTVDTAEKREQRRKARAEERKEAQERGLQILMAENQSIIDDLERQRQGS